MLLKIYINFKKTNANYVYMCYNNKNVRRKTNEIKRKSF